MMVLIGGGLVSFWGPVIGAAFFILARDLLGAYTETWLLWYGLLFMAMVLFKPEGIAGHGRLAAQRRAVARGRAARRGRLTHGAASKPASSAQALRRPVVLEDIDLAFEAGRLAGIMGPNGAGKTTCFNVPDRPLRARPRRGAVRRRGHHRPRAARDRAPGHRALVPGHEPVRRRQRARQRAGRAAGRARRAGSMSRATCGARRRARRRGGSRARARRPARARSSRRAKSLSYGERRALEIAVALAARPRLLFLDEPTAGLGAEGTARLAELVRELKRDLTIVDHRARHAVPVRARRPDLGDPLGPGHRARARRRSCARTRGCSARTSGSSHERRRSRPGRSPDRRAAPTARAGHPDPGVRRMRHGEPMLVVEPSTPSTARRRRCSTCRSRSAPARWSRCSARTAPARRRRCARSSA